jgi:tetratricopeptide (TPR) repeat protein
MASAKHLLKRHIEAGLRKHEHGQIDAAAAAYRQALALAPTNPQALHLLGTAELQLGYAQDAAHHLERAAQAMLNHPGLLGNLAQAYFTLGRFADAHEAFRKASQLDPHQVRFQMGMANALAMQGRFDAAEALLRSIVERHPHEFLPWFNFGNVLRDQGKHADALDCYGKAIELQPRFAGAHNNLGSALHSLFRFDAAETAYRACLALDPDHVQAKYNLASVTMDAGKFQEAESVCRELVARAPEDTVACAFLGAVLFHQGKTREALQCHRRAAELAPHDARAAETLASALAGTGRIDEALTEFARALALDPASDSARCSRSGALLAAGRFAEGWGDYRYREASKIIGEKLAQLKPTRFLPAELIGSTILLLREQGLGDELFFLRFAPVLRNAEARVTYCSDPKLRSLLERVDCLDAVTNGSADLPQADSVMLVGDLPYALNEYAKHRRSGDARDATAWPETPPPLELTPEPARVDAMRQRLRQAGDGPYIGISWRGGIPPREQSGSGWNLFKTIDLEKLAGALRTFPGTIVALQRNPTRAEIDAFSLAHGRTVHDFSAANEDLEDMLALLALIDEYVGVSNTNMHLRAGLGKSARVLVPQPAEWRWMVSGNRSPWFADFSVYRQSSEGDWTEALASLAHDLQATLRNPGAD